MICPLCGKETMPGQNCSACGGDMQWAQVNQMDVAVIGADVGGVINHDAIPTLRPELAKNPVLQEMGMVRWLETTGMPEWLKAEIKKNEKNTRHNKSGKRRK